MKLSKELKSDQIVFLVDTREQNPLDFSVVKTRELFRVEPATLTTGDYSVKGLEQTEICVERKSLDDLLMCVGRERERFERELLRMRAFPAKMVVVEATWDQLDMGLWRSKISPAQVQGSVIRWMTLGIPFFFATGPHEAARVVANFMWLHAKSCFERVRDFHETFKPKTPAAGTTAGELSGEET